MHFARRGVRIGARVDAVETRVRPSARLPLHEDRPLPKRPAPSALPGIALLAAGLLAFAPLAAAAAAEDWLPLGAGRRMLYEAHRDHSFRPENGKIDRLFHKGRMTQRHRDAGSLAPGAVAIEERMELVPLGAGMVERTLEARVFDAADGIVLRASGAIAREGEDPPQRYTPPLRMLPTDEPGHAWKVGAFRDREMQIELRGEVRRLGPLAEEPGCESCLEVRYEGPISGQIPVAGGAAKIESGRFERTIWLKRGVGIVREVANVETELLLPDETRASTSHTLTLRLVEHDAGP